MDKLKYIPEITEEKKEENYSRFRERIALYKKHGLDFVKSREFILQKAGTLFGSILEIGSGTGYTTVFLAEAGYKFITVDKDPESLKITALNLAYKNLISNVVFYVMNAEALVFKNESFNNIICVNLFHHIKKIDKILSEMDRVLCKGGKIILADFNKRGMEIIDKVYKAEGRVHENFGISRDYVYSYFDDLKYKVEKYEETCHWVLISKKL